MRRTAKVLGTVLLGVVAASAHAQDTRPLCQNGRLTLDLAGSDTRSFQKLACASVAVTLRDAAQLTVGLVLADTVAVSAAGAGRLGVSVMSSGALDLSLQDSAQVSVQGGHVATLTIVNTGTGLADLDAMGARNASVVLPAAGSALVDVHRGLAGTVSGSGELHNKSHPSLAQVVVSGTGRYRIGDEP